MHCSGVPELHMATFLCGIFYFHQGDDDHGWGYLFLMILILWILILTERHLHIDGAANVCPLVHSGAHHKAAFLTQFVPT